MSNAAVEATQNDWRSFPSYKNERYTGNSGSFTHAHGGQEANAHAPQGVSNV